LTASEYESGTFTIVNVGAYGVRQMEAIVQQPQSCILSMGAAAPQVVPNLSGEGDEFQVSTVATATLSCDHRVVDGAVGAAWLAEFKTLIENPAKLLL
jgi:pyruvate dehydrogenase E2 component (dihydrolipoamide acetyltransferase)